ncbi:MAG TPA: hypothetical protein VH186_26075 [Chloroflexia bacterium]|nr:hypothetical protein [Chloroflexia bacterium]
MENSGNFLTQHIHQESARSQAESSGSLPEQDQANLLELLKYMQDAIHKAAQPLTAILTLSEMIVNSGHLDDSYQEDIKVIMDQALELKEIVHNVQSKFREKKL